MQRPRPTLRTERAVVNGMPIARGVDRQVQFGEQREAAVEHRDHRIAFWHLQATAGQKIVLYIDDQQRIASMRNQTDHHGLHLITP